MGNLVPMLAALLAVPWLLQRLGAERFGVLSLVWVVVGYFSFLDMGLGRAVTVAVAPLRAPEGEAAGAPRADAPARRQDEIDILGAAATLVGAFGLAFILAVGAALALWRLPMRMSSPALSREATTAIWIMLPAIPPLLWSSVLRGHLEGIGAFRPLNAIRGTSGALLVLGPVLAVLVEPDLIWACAAIVAVRLATLAWLGRLVAARLDLPGTRLARIMLWGGHGGWRRRLLAFGVWATVSNIVGSVMVYLDRFVIAFMMSAAAVAVYSVPFDVISRLPVIVAALCTVLLPELARIKALGGVQPAVAAPDADPCHSDAAALAPAGAAAQRIVRLSTLASLAIVAPLVLAAIALAPWALGIWLGDEFARQSAAPARVLLLAFGINAMAQIPFTALQASGHARAVALVHLAEFLPYLALVIWAIGADGLVGAAWAWTLRGTLDYAALWWVWRKLAGPRARAA